MIVMNKQLVKDGLGWGVGLWLFGYALGMVLFTVVPPGAIGWIILPIGTGATIWVLFKKIKAETMGYYLGLAIIWILIAMIFDYFFLVKAFKPADGYYKLDVYLYYLLIFSLPILAGKYKTAKDSSRNH